MKKEWVKPTMTFLSKEEGDKLMGKIDETGIARNGQTVVFDFDGVIHSYTSGWQGTTTIPDEPVPGIKEALKDFRDAGYEVVVVSTRCKTEDGRDAILDYLEKYGMYPYVDMVLMEKPPAVCYIDDRAICFDGHPETLLGKVKTFRPWNK